MEHQHQQKYTCPMHPEIVQDKPGKCPKCGMNLVPVKDEAAKSMSHAHHDMNPPIGHEGHDHHAMMIVDFKNRFWISLILTVPILLLSEMIQHWLRFDLRFAGDKYVLLILSSFIFFYGGWPFLKGITEELKAKSPGMMTLIALAITVAVGLCV
jgi:Cu2+-exporting ATPase